MQTPIELTLREFEAGRMSRRQAVARLGALFALASGGAQLFGAASGSAEPEASSPGTTFQATELNHIALQVADVPRSRDFYIQHLGLTLDREGSNNAFLNCGKNFVALFQRGTPGMDHYCYSVKDYDAANAVERLNKANLPDIRRSGDRVYFSDPDGLTVQVAAEQHLP